MKKHIVGLITVALGCGVLTLVLSRMMHSSPVLSGPETESHQITKQDDAAIFGAATAEETLALFIRVFEDGNAIEASRYFEPEHRKEWEETLQGWIQKNQHHAIADALSEATSGQLTSENSYQLVSLENGRAGIVIDFVKYGDIWAIERF